VFFRVGLLGHRTVLGSVSWEFDAVSGSRHLCVQYLALRLVSGEQHLFRACFSTLGCWVFAPFLGILLLGCGPCAFVPLYLRIFGQLGLCTTSLKRFFFDRTGSCLRFLFFRFSFFVFLFPFFLFSSSFFLFSFFFLPSVPFLSPSLHFCYVT